jgi:hypothetical protein
MFQIKLFYHSKKKLFTFCSDAKLSLLSLVAELLKNKKNIFWKLQDINEELEKKREKI